MFFIAGITGNIGGAAAETLLAEGEQVRAVVRDLGKHDAPWEQGITIWESLRDILRLLQKRNEIDR
jgi:NAD(P)H dehydrogenase (quinone)